MHLLAESSKHAATHVDSITKFKSTFAMYSVLVRFGVKKRENFHIPWSSPGESTRQ